MNKSGYLLAEVALEVAHRLPDAELKMPRAEWRHMVIDTAIQMIEEEAIDDSTEDIDEIVAGALAEGE